MPDDARVFISYSTKDGADFAAQLREDLIEAEFSVWQDLIALEGGRDWWSQIEAALKLPVLQHFVLVVTPGALESPVVRREIRLARQEGKTVSPVKGPDMPEPSSLPRWLGQVYDLDRPEHHRTFTRVLEAPSQVGRVPMMAPEPPAEFIERPAEFEALKSLLLSEETGDAIAITAALQGAGGYGKTTLARALAHDPDIFAAYFDGILWVELGEQGGDRVLPLISDLVTLIAGAPPEVSTIDGARTALGEALGDRRMLLVIDDVWEKRDLEPFLHGGRNTTRLVTTRFNRVLSPETRHRKVDAMQVGEALTLVGWGLPDGEVAQSASALADLAARLGEWALLLKLANGFLRDRVTKLQRPLETAITDVNRRLDARGYTALDKRRAETYQARNESVAVMMRTSLELLDSKEKQERYGELAVFPEDADIPVGIVTRLWQETGGLDKIDTEDLLCECLDLSLLLSLDMDREVIRFHDTVRHFLQEQAGPEGLKALHARLLPALELASGEYEQVYRYRYLLDHVSEAGERALLDDLLLDPAWLAAKLDVLKSPLTLVADFDRHGASPAHDLIGRTLRLTSGICVRDPRQLIPQLCSRLMEARLLIELGVVKRLKQSIPKPCLMPLRPSLTPPGAETARLEGHEGQVTALAMLPDGRLASGSYDTSVRLWNLESGRETAHLEGHKNLVAALVVLPDGRLASGSWDKTVRLWDPERGQETARLEGHKEWVNALAVLPDGRLVSGSNDTTVRLWNLENGHESALLEGHEDWVNALAVLPDGRIASGSNDTTIRLWDLEDGRETARLEGHTSFVSVLTVLRDGRLASGSSDKTIRLWDPESGRETARLEGHEGGVTALAVLPDGRLATGSWGSRLRLWDPGAGQEISYLEGQENWVSALAVLPDGRLASGSWGNTVRLWGPESGRVSVRLESHENWVSALVVLWDDRLASGSWDKTLRLWDPESGRETARMEGHTDWVNALAELPDGRLASGSNDSTVRLWDLETGQESTLLKGHTGWVTALALLPDGRLASGSDDKTVCLWDPQSGRETARLEGHAGVVSALVALPDGRLASGSWDKTVRLWDPKSGRETARLEGHAGEVSALVVLQDGRLASGSWDKTIRLWSLETGQETARLEGHWDKVTALVALPGGRLASGSWDNTICLWAPESGREIARLEADAGVQSLASLSNGCLVAGDGLGRLHWLELVE